MRQAKGGAGFVHEHPNEGGTNVWLTPPHVIEALGPFDLDPCACTDAPFKTAEHSIALPEDGLADSWHGRVWLNPPYGPHTGVWLDRLAAHGNGIALIFARTDTKAFRIIWNHADAILFLRGRLAFYRPDGTKGLTAGAPSVLAAFGENNTISLRESGLPGCLVDGWENHESP